MKRAIIITSLVAAAVNADSDWGWGNGDWSGKSDCVNSCISDWSDPNTIISSACPTGTITGGPSKPTLFSCLESACPDWFPSSKWDDISSKVGDACSSWSSCKTGSDAKTYTWSYDDDFWSDKSWTATKTADVVTFTGCADGDGWGDFFGGDWSGWGDDSDGDWDDDWKDYCDDNGNWKRDAGDWTSSYSCVPVTSTITYDNGAVSTVVGGSPTTFLAAVTGDSDVVQTTSPAVPPGGAAATAAVGMIAGAVVGVAMMVAV